MSSSEQMLEIGLWVAVWLVWFGLLVFYVWRKVVLLQKPTAGQRMFRITKMQTAKPSPASKATLEKLIKSFALKDPAPEKTIQDNKGLQSLIKLVVKKSIKPQALFGAKKPAIKTKPATQTVKKKPTTQTKPAVPQPAVDPNSLAGLQQQAAELVAQKKYVECLEKIQQHPQFSKSMKEQPSTGFLWYYKGYCEIKIGLAREAKASLQACFQQFWPHKNTDWLEHLKQVIDAFQQAGEAQQAVFFCHLELDFQQSKPNWPAVHQVYDKMAQLYEQLGQKNQYIEILESQQQLYAKQGNHQAQMQWLDQLGKAYFDQGNQQKSKLCYQQSLELKNKA